jgi:hypothetical protein
MLSKVGGRCVGAMRAIYGRCCSSLSYALMRFIHKRSGQVNINDTDNEFAILLHLQLIYDI